MVASLGTAFARVKEPILLPCPSSTERRTYGRPMQLAMTCPASSTDTGTVAGGVLADHGHRRGVGFGIVYGVVRYGLCGNTGTVPCDAYSYWAVDGTPYTWETNLEYRYSPAFLWVIAPLQALPFEVFLGIWTAAHIAALIWLRAGWFLIVPGLNEDVLRGNISTFIALFAVLAIRHSAAWWVPVLLTKITPAVGLVWHAVRREWRSLGDRRGRQRRDRRRSASCRIPSYGAHGSIRWPTPTRPTRSAIRSARCRLRVAIGGRRHGIRRVDGRAWLVPIAMFLAVPGLWAFNWALLAAVPRLIGYGRERRAERPRDPAHDSAAVPAVDARDAGRRRVPARRSRPRLRHRPGRLRLRLHVLLPAGRRTGDHRSVDALRLVRHVHLPLHAARCAPVRAAGAAVRGRRGVGMGRSSSWWCSS